MAGPNGDAQRRMHNSTVRLLATFDAGSHFEAMTIYNKYLGRETYTTNQPWDFEPYPEEWFLEQQQAGVFKHDR